MPSAAGAAAAGPGGGESDGFGRRSSSEEMGEGRELEVLESFRKAVVELYDLSPLEKWNLFGKLPHKAIAHVLLLACTSFLCIAWALHWNEYLLRTTQNACEFFLPADCSPDDCQLYGTETKNDCRLYSMNATTEAVQRAVDNYYNINVTSLADYMFQADDNGVIKPAKLHVTSADGNGLETKTYSLTPTDLGPIDPETNTQKEIDDFYYSVVHMNLDIDLNDEFYGDWLRGCYAWRFQMQYAVRSRSNIRVHPRAKINDVCPDTGGISTSSTMYKLEYVVHMFVIVISATSFILTVKDLVDSYQILIFVRTVMRLFQEDVFPENDVQQWADLRRQFIIAANLPQPSTRSGGVESAAKAGDAGAGGNGDGDSQTPKSSRPETGGRGPALDDEGNQNATTVVGDLDGGGNRVSRFDSERDHDEWEQEEEEGFVVLTGRSRAGTHSRDPARKHSHLLDLPTTVYNSRLSDFPYTWDELPWEVKMRFFNLWSVLMLPAVGCAFAFSMSFVVQHDGALPWRYRAELLAVSTGLLWLTTVSYMRHSDRLYAIVLVLQGAGREALRVLIGCAPIFLGVMLFGVVVFGTGAPQFNDLSLSFQTLFSVMNGDVIQANIDSLWQLYPYLGGAFVIVFFFVFNYVIIRMIIAVLEETLLFLHVYSDIHKNRMEWRADRTAFLGANLREALKPEHSIDSIISTGSDGPPPEDFLFLELMQIVDQHDSKLMDEMLDANRDTLGAEDLKAANSVVSHARRVRGDSAQEELAVHAAATHRRMRSDSARSLESNGEPRDSGSSASDAGAGAAAAAKQQGDEMKK